jgi:hypothetical protein
MTQFLTMPSFILKQPSTHLLPCTLQQYILKALIRSPNYLVGSAKSVETYIGKFGLWGL